MDSNGIELPTKAQQQARNLQRMHDEEQSFLRNGGPDIDGNDDHSYDDDEEGYVYPQEQPSDCAVLFTAWSRLSCPTRSILSVLFSVACFYGVYTLGVGEGVREETHFLSGKSNGKNHRNGPEANKHYMSLQNAFTPQLIKSTRKASKELIDLLHDYYGGEEQAKKMLMSSWQAGWELDKELFLSGDEEYSSADGFLDEAVRTDISEKTEDDSLSDDSTEDDSNISKREKRKKKKKKKKQSSTNDDRKLKKGKVVKALNDPADMNDAQKHRWHQSKKERVTKLITTMARALLNPNQGNFIVGTIGR